MSAGQKLKHELKAVAAATLYFALWFGGILFLKKLILEEYEVEFFGLSKALVGALILAKVVLIMEHVPLGAWVRRSPAWLDMLLRTLLYTAGVVVVLMLEKGFEGRREHGGFGPALQEVLVNANHYHIWFTTLCVSGSLLSYNALAVIRRHLGEGGLFRIFAAPMPPAETIQKPENS